MYIYMRSQLVAAFVILLMHVYLQQEVGGTVMVTDREHLIDLKTGTLA